MVDEGERLSDRTMDALSWRCWETMDSREKYGTQ
jgi:hypothetical protein